MFRVPVLAMVLLGSTGGAGVQDRIAREPFGPLPATRERGAIPLVMEMRGRRVVIVDYDLLPEGLALVLIRLDPGEGTEPLMRGQLGQTVSHMERVLRSIQAAPGGPTRRDGTLQALELLEKQAMDLRRLLPALAIELRPPEAPRDNKAIVVIDPEPVARQGWDRTWHALREALVWARNAGDAAEVRQALEQLDGAILRARQEVWRAAISAP